MYRAAADLPVSQIVIRAAKFPADRVRYEAETRAWVAAAQADLAAKAGVLACEVKLMTAEYALEPGKDGACFWVPQRLWSMYPAAIKKGSHCLNTFPSAPSVRPASPALTQARL